MKLISTNKGGSRRPGKSRKGEIFPWLIFSFDVFHALDSFCSHLQLDCPKLVSQEKIVFQRKMILKENLKDEKVSSAFIQFCYEAKMC